jgi:TonB family protein
MFEKVLAGDRRRIRQRTRFALTASIAAHAVVAMGAARIPLARIHPSPSVEEVVSFVELPAPKAEAKRPERPRVERPTPATAPGLQDASGESSPRPPDVGEVADTPERLPDLSASLVMPVSLSGAPSLRLPRFATARAEGPDASAARGEVLEADVLAERPRLANRWQMERIWQQLYPRVLEMARISGEAVISFVIDENGRVESESVELLSASRPEFGQAVLRGVNMLRFQPMRVGGVPVRVRTVLPVLWRLDERQF